MADAVVHGMLWPLKLLRWVATLGQTKAQTTDGDEMLFGGCGQCDFGPPNLTGKYLLHRRVPSAIDHQLAVTTTTAMIYPS
jgi:hypothetical protein